jgi:hypothetical protein
MSTFWPVRYADDRLLSQNSPKKPSTRLDFCAHLQGICPVLNSSIPAPGQKAVEGGHRANRIASLRSADALACRPMEESAADDLDSWNCLNAAFLLTDRRSTARRHRCRHTLQEWVAA